MVYFRRRFPSIYRGQISRDLKSFLKRGMVLAGSREFRESLLDDWGLDDSTHAIACYSYL